MFWPVWRSDAPGPLRAHDLPWPHLMSAGPAHTCMRFCVMPRGPMSRPMKLWLGYSSCRQALQGTDRLVQTQHLGCHAKDTNTQALNAIRCGINVPADRPHMHSCCLYALAVTHLCAHTRTHARVRTRTPAAHTRAWLTRMSHLR